VALDAQHRDGAAISECRNSHQSPLETQFACRPTPAHACHPQLLESSSVRASRETAAVCRDISSIYESRSWIYEMSRKADPGVSAPEARGVRDQFPSLLSAHLFPLPRLRLAQHNFRS
jgi:hypothetical protein